MSILANSSGKAYITTAGKALRMNRSVIYVTSNRGATITLIGQTSGGQWTYTLGANQNTIGFNVEPDTYVATASKTGYDTETTTVTAQVGLAYSIELNLFYQGYTELEYIQSSGTQYIDTGYKPTTENFKAEFALQGSTLSKNTFGSMNNTSDTNWFTDFAHSSNTITFYIGSTGRATTCSVSDKTNISIETTSSKALTIKINGTQQGATSFSGTILGNTGNFCLFTVGSTTYTPTRKSTTKFYYCKLTQDGVLVRSLVPAKRKVDDMVGMYDEVNNVFYYDVAGGNFIAGPEV